MVDSILISFLRKSLGLSDSFELDFLAEDWIELHHLAERQSVLGPLYSGVCQLPENQRPPKSLFFRWGMEAEAIRGLNKKMDATACRLTQIFAELGCRSVILKGQANALLYPDPGLRQSGDIDIWVEGGRLNVLEVLSKANLLESASVGLHDVTLPARRFGFPVEVHFQACSGNRNPFSNRRLQEYLNQELKRISPCTKGFNVPSTKFALVMQLSHIQRHFLTVGIGLRQIVDYYFLLISSTAEDRSEIRGLLDKFGLTRVAGALMWVLQDLLLLDNLYLLCSPDCSRGERFLADILEGGDFGQYSKRTRGSLVGWWLKGKFRLISLLFFDFPEVSWQLFRSATETLFKFPYRIRQAHSLKIGRYIK